MPLPRRHLTIATIALAFATFSVAAAAKEAAPARPEAFRKLIDCRAIADNAARLACYDAEVAKVDEAESRNELVIVDKAQVRKARKGLFGLNLPDLGIFGSGKDGAPDVEVNEIESTIASARVNQAGKLMLTLEDGARWVQIDSNKFRLPKAGLPVKIRRAAMGSFFANIDGRPAIRMRREN